MKLEKVEKSGTSDRLQLQLCDGCIGRSSEEGRKEEEQLQETHQ
jgi:hypothetical protein